MRHYAVIAAIAALALAGCGSKEEMVAVGPDGTKVTSSNDGKNVTITGPNGEKVTASEQDGVSTYSDDKGNKMSVGGSITEDQLGLPFYPGSAEMAGRSMITEASGKKVVISTRTTKDDPEKVAAFYKEKVENAKDYSATTGDQKISSVTGRLKGGTVAVSAMRQGAGDTEITVSVEATTP